MRHTWDFERHAEVNLYDWDVLHSRGVLIHLYRKRACFYSFKERNKSPAQKRIKELVDVGIKVTKRQLRLLLVPSGRTERL